MNSNDVQSAFSHVLGWLKDKNLPTSKIAIQKTMFYLQEKGVPLGLDFEPYSYGPFSRRLMETASEMERSGEIIVGRTEYSPGSAYFDTLPENERSKIDVHLQRFAETLRHDFSFDNLELYGTVLYCIQALQENNMNTDRESVIQEVKSWKHSKYARESISTAYDALAPEFVQ